jgi:hypothetical protein
MMPSPDLERESQFSNRLLYPIIHPRKFTASLRDATVSPRLLETLELVLLLALFLSAATSWRIPVSQIDVSPVEIFAWIFIFWRWTVGGAEITPPARQTPFYLRGGPRLRRLDRDSAAVFQRRTTAARDVYEMAFGGSADRRPAAIPLDRRETGGRTVCPGGAYSQYPLFVRLVAAQTFGIIRYD